MNSDYAMIISTCNSMESARQIAGILIDKRIAACIQMFPVESLYTWQGKVCEDNEITLLIKTKTALSGKAITIIKNNHPYEIPEIIQLPITDGLPDYFRWIDECVDE